MDIEKLLYDLYYIKHNYDGINQLYNKAKLINKNIKIEDVKNWLNKQKTHQVNLTKVEKKEFLPIYSDSPYSFQVDLTFFPRYKNNNNGNFVLFTAINVNTKFVYAYYSDNKKMNTILDFIKQMENKTLINSLTLDKGKEFFNNEFIEFCKNKNINLFFVLNDSHKLGIINRFHRTLKDKLTKHFYANDTYKWIDVIDDIIKNYNNTINRSTGLEPIKINSFIENQIINNKRDETNLIKTGKHLFSTGDFVRIKNKKKLFDDKQKSKFSNEIFQIVKVLNNSAMLNNDEKFKLSELIKVENIENKELINIPKNIIENKIKNKLKREDLNTVVIDEKRKREPNKKYKQIELDETGKKYVYL